MRTGGGDHKLAGKVGQALQDCCGIFFAAGLAGDDHGAGVHILAGDAGMGILGLDDGLDAFAIHKIALQKGSKVDGTFV